MAIEFSVPAPYDKRGWKLKIRDKERVEPPHVSLLHKTRCWRFGLREQEFLDGDPPHRDAPGKLFDDLLARTEEFVVEWDKLYPENPVYSGRDHDSK